MVTNNAGEGAEDEAGQPFVAKEDRPEVRLTPDTPLSEIRLRDLPSILGVLASKNPEFEIGKTSLGDFFDHKEDFDDVIKSPEKQYEKDPDTDPKAEKVEKLEKLEKLEIDHHSKNVRAEGGVAVGYRTRTDPRMDDVIRVLTGLRTEVRHLADQMQELQGGASSEH
jgi:hypothetical protein